MKTYTVETIREITQEQIDDVLADAFEHGVSYWCDEIRVKKQPKGENYTYASDALTRGHNVALHDAEESKWEVLTIDSFVKALGDMQFDFDNYDAMDADAVVQKAVFGEVVYG